MERENTIGFRVRTLSVSIKRAVDVCKSKTENRRCTGTHGWVIGYLYENRGKDVFQRDIEKQFSVRKPTMTAILQLMEKNGLIKRVRSESDARLKKIELTELALEIHKQHEHNIECFENYIRSGVSDEELEVFFRVMDKISENVTRAEKDYIFPEEDKNA